MTVFTSERERRLWLWALIVMVAIYASLGPARILVDALRERNLLRVAFFGLVLVVVVAVGVQWFKKRPGWSEIGVGLGVALAYWMTFLRIENPAERTHLIEYGVVAALIHMALLERIGNAQPVRWPAGLTVGVTALLGLMDEGIQFFLPSRVFDWNDVFFNAFGVYGCGCQIGNRAGESSGMASVVHVAGDGSGRMGLEHGCWYIRAAAAI